ALALALRADKASEAYLLLARIYLRDGDKAKLADTVKRCFRKYPHEPAAADSLYLLGTALSEEGDYDGALDALGRLTKAFPEWPRTDEALWQEGWARYKEKDYAAAGDSFSMLYADYPDSSLAPQALYWRSKTLGLDGDDKDASLLIGQLESSYPYSFYGLISAQPPRIFSDSPANEKIPDPGEAGEDVQDEPPASPDARLRTAYELGEQGLDGLALRELRRAEGLFKLPQEADKLVDAYHFLGEYRRPLELASSEYSRSFHAGKTGIPADVLKDLFPLPYWDAVYLEAEGYGLDPWLINAVIRQESHCSPDAVSPVGAVGLMQLLQGTADAMCRKMDVTSPGKGGLKNYYFNIPIGSYYLRQLLKKHGGRLAYVLAEYNAGPGALARWTSGGDMPDDYFIENIDYPETRGYVKKVLRNYFMYKKLYSK
ncbi:MAG: lytic transglycosylase domain-containing protein, partial [Nitrospirota bacterium]